MSVSVCTRTCTYTYMDMYVHIYFNRAAPHGMIVLPPGNMHCLTETSLPTMGNFPPLCWLGECKHLHNQHSLLPFTLVTFQNLDPIAEDNTHFRQTTWRSRAGTDLVLFISKGAVQAVKGEEQSIFLPSCKAHEPQ